MVDAFAHYRCGAHGRQGPRRCQVLPPWLRCHNDDYSFAVRNLFAVAAVSAPVAETMHWCLMKDDRLLKYAQEYRMEVEQHIVELTEVPSLA